MDVQIVKLYVLGIFLLYMHSCCASSLTVSRFRRFLDNDQRTRNKRNATYTNKGNITTNSGGVVDNVTQAPDWMKYYGSENYMQRKAYKENPNKKPTICFNNKTQENGLLLNHFICPMENDTDAQTYCCGEVSAQTCCSKTEYEKKGDSEDLFTDIDIVTGISIATGFIVSIALCMFLYCCCCQRRHEIHDGVKLMWVRRSFGKELNRLEQPANQDHMTVVNSITGIRETSRQGSRQGSRHGSRQQSRQGSVRSNRSRQGSFKVASRNPSAVPTPSISRRASNGHYDHATEKHHTGIADRNSLGLDVHSNVVITVTTPSDDQGPTAPLLKTASNTNVES